MLRGITLTLYRIYKTFSVSEEEDGHAINGYRKLHGCNETFMQSQ